jgi:sortase (surface protein transpeptidase)
MPKVDKARRRRRLLLPVAAGLAALLVGCGAGGQTTSPPAPPATEQQQVSSPGEGTAEEAGMAKSEPVSIDIPKIGARSTLVQLGLNADGTVQVPPVSQPMQAGWYSYSPTPGETGPAVILGHVDGNKQQGIFYRLKELTPGDKISIARKDGSTARFEVTRVDQVPKEAFPTDAVYDNTVDPELRLITCGGSFDHAAHNYRDNVIVYAALQH